MTYKVHVNTFKQFVLDAFYLFAMADVMLWLNISKKLFEKLQTEEGFKLIEYTDTTVGGWLEGVECYARINSLRVKMNDWHLEIV